MSAIFLYAARRDLVPPRHPHEKRVQIGLLILALLIASVWHGFMPTYAQTCTELLPDGSFETRTGWTTQSDGNYPLLNAFHPRTGLQGAYLGGTNSAKDSVSTNPALPGDHTITFSFWWQVQSAESSSDWDGLNVVVADVAGTPLRTLLTLSDANATDTWQQTTVDLSAYAGQVVQIQFAAQTDTTLVTDFFVDDVSLMACGRTTTSEETTQNGNETNTETPTETDPNNTETGTEAPAENNTTTGDNPESTPDPSVNPETSASFEFYLPLLQR